MLDLFSVGKCFVEVGKIKWCLNNNIDEIVSDEWWVYLYLFVCVERCVYFLGFKFGDDVYLLCFNGYGI